MRERNDVITTHGGYRKLKSYQVARLAYDVTVRFCERYIDPKSRTRDQMVQAARSGVQNIAEGSQASGTSKKTELKLTNVARASLEELRLDYEDFLRHRGLKAWGNRDVRTGELIARKCTSVEEVAEWVRDVRDGRIGPDGLDGLNGRGRLIGRNNEREFANFTSGNLSSTSNSSNLSNNMSTYPEIAANGALALIAVACSLLDRQITSLAVAFEKEGGFTERLYRVRSSARDRAH